MKEIAVSSTKFHRFSGPRLSLTEGCGPLTGYLDSQAFLSLVSRQPFISPPRAQAKQRYGLGVFPFLWLPPVFLSVKLGLNSPQLVRVLFKKSTYNLSKCMTQNLAHG